MLAQSTTAWGRCSVSLGAASRCPPFTPARDVLLPVAKVAAGPHPACPAPITGTARMPGFRVYPGAVPSLRSPWLRGMGAGVEVTGVIGRRGRADDERR